MSEQRHEIELGFWIPILVVVAVCTAIAFGSYKAGVKNTKSQVVRQCDSPFPLRIDDNEFTCYRLKK